MFCPQFIRTLFRPFSPQEAAARELAEAKLQKLMSDTGVDFAQAQSDYNAKRIARLQKFLLAEAKAEAAAAPVKEPPAADTAGYNTAGFP